MTNYCGPVVERFNTPPCHGGDRRFKSGRDRRFGAVAQLVEQRIEAPCVGSSTLSSAIFLVILIVKK